MIRENITDLKAEGWTFGVESSKSKGKKYSKFIRQRRIKGTKNKHERVYLKAKDEDDYRNRVLRDQARLQVFNNLADGWTSEGLTASEGASLDIIINEFQSKTRNPIIMEYARQLGLRVRSKKYGFTSVRRMQLQEKMNILKAASKQFKRHLFTKKTEIVPKSTVDSGGYFTLNRAHNLRQAKTAVQPIILID